MSFLRAVGNSSRLKLTNFVRRTREPSPNDPPSATQRPKAKRGRRPKFNPSTIALNVQEPRAEPSAG